MPECPYHPGHFTGEGRRCLPCDANLPSTEAQKQAIQPVREYILAKFVTAAGEVIKEYHVPAPAPAGS